MCSFSRLNKNWGGLLSRGDSYCNTLQAAVRCSHMTTCSCDVVITAGKMSVSYFLGVGGQDM